MIELKNLEASALISCENEECGGLTFRHEVEQNNGNCPFCGKSIWKPERQMNLSQISWLDVD